MNGTKNNTLEIPNPVTIQERISRKLLRVYMANFRSVPDALLELVDNAFDEFDGFHGGTHLEVTIKITKDSIIVEKILFISSSEYLYICLLDRLLSILSLSRTALVLNVAILLNRS